MLVCWGHTPASAREHFIGATNRDLKQMVYDREFRKNLYYRLNVFPIALPPLRERKADISERVEYFMQQYSVSVGKTIEKPVANACGSALEK